MTLSKTICSMVLAAGLLMPISAHAADKKMAKEYQVTGPILAIDDDIVTIQKGDEKWEIQISSETKVDGKLAVGQKVTIHYRMIAKSVEQSNDKKG